MALGFLNVAKMEPKYLNSLSPLEIMTYLLECSPELSGHEAVDDEVDAAVEECHHVHQVAKWGVALKEEPLSKHHAKEG